MWHTAYESPLEKSATYLYSVMIVCRSGCCVGSATCARRKPGGQSPLVDACFSHSSTMSGSELRFATSSTETSA